MQKIHSINETVAVFTLSSTINIVDYNVLFNECLMLFVC